MLAQSMLYEFEKGLNPQHPEKSQIPAKIIGYGEISAIFEIQGDHVNVYKRLPLFDSVEVARHYEQLYYDYCRHLTESGLSLPPHATQIVAPPDRPVALYISQKKIPDECFGHKRIHHPDDSVSLDFIEQVVREISKIWNFNSKNTPDIELAIDGQLSNWIIDPDQSSNLCYIDTSTPLFCIHGVEQQEPELLLKSTPGFMRWIIRLFFLKDVMTRYYIPRMVFMDLVANLSKEQRPDLIAPSIELVNKHLPEDQLPLSKTEVEKYYQQDKMIWSIFLFLRQVDRFFTTRLLRRRYEFILPGKIKR